MDERTRRALKALIEAATTAKIALDKHAFAAPGDDGVAVPNVEMNAIMELNLALEIASELEGE
jgi:hypothetical protein